MGQYFLCCNLTSYRSMTPFRFGMGLKLGEHGRLGDALMRAVESLLAPGGPWHKCQLLWAGDGYAGPAPLTWGGQRVFAAFMCGAVEEDRFGSASAAWRFLINHSKREFLDTSTMRSGALHPLTLLCSESWEVDAEDGRDMPLVGRWAANKISVANKAPEGFKEVVWVGGKIE